MVTSVVIIVIFVTNSDIGGFQATKLALNQINDYNSLSGDLSTLELYFSFTHRKIVKIDIWPD